MFSKIFLSLAGLLFSLSTTAQVLSVDPAFPNQNDTVTITFDATQGNGALTGVVPVYAHTGVITQANGPGNWQNVQGNWGTADSRVLMSPLGNNQHSITYHIPTFYGLGAATTVTELAFVFRNANGSVVGRANDGSDIFYPIYPTNAGFLAAFLSPSQTQITTTGANLSFSIATNQDADIDVFDNGVLQASATAVRSFNPSFQAGGPGLHTVELVADNGSTIVRDTVFYVINSPVNVQAAPTGTEYGINYISPSSVVLKLHAPFKNYIYVLGDFNNWEANPNYFMIREPNGEDWWLRIDSLNPGQRYALQYWVDGNLRIADPYSELVLDPWNDGFIDSITYPNPHPYPTGKTTGITTLIHMDKPQYQWRNSFTPIAKDELIIYELLVRDFVADHNYLTLIDTLNYLERLGVNAIELMPVQEFEGNESWGYNPSFHLALDKYYGTPEHFKAFIDTCHGRGFAVIVDKVLNHAFGQSPLVQLYFDPTAGQFGQPSPQNPWFNETPRHDFNVGYDFNHQSPATQEFARRAVQYWMEEYRIDGYRMDLSKGFTQNNTLGNIGAWNAYDQSRIDILSRIKSQVEAINPNAIMILEHFADNAEELELSNRGFMLWGNMHYNYGEANMGFVNNSDFSAAFHSQRGWSFKHLIAYQESHDEERQIYMMRRFGNSSGNYSTRSLNTALARKELGSLFLYLIPGPKMLWQFGELGYDIGINDPCRTCNKPILWNYQQDPARAQLYRTTAEIINLRRQQPVFNTNNFRYQLGGAFKRINLDHPSMNATLVGNFDVVSASGRPGFQNTGWWYEYFSGDSINVTDPFAIMNLQAGEYRLYTDQKLEKVGLLGERVNTIIEDGYSLFPNPASDQLSLELSQKDWRHFSLSIHALDGTVVRRYAPEQVKQIGTWTFPLEGIPAGAYLVRIESDRTSSTQQLIIKP